MYICSYRVADDLSPSIIHMYVVYVYFFITVYIYMHAYLNKYMYYVHIYIFLHMFIDVYMYLIGLSMIYHRLSYMCIWCMYIYS